MSKRLDYVQGVEPLLDYVALGLRSPLQWRLVDFGLPRFPRQLQKTRPEGGRKRNRSARIMHIFVDQLVVLAYAESLVCVIRHQRRIGKFLIEVIEYQRRLNDDLAIMYQRRHDAVGIELHISPHSPDEALISATLRPIQI